MSDDFEIKKKHKYWHEGDDNFEYGVMRFLHCQKMLMDLSYEDFDKLSDNGKMIIGRLHNIHNLEM